MSRISFNYAKAGSRLFGITAGQMLWVCVPLILLIAMSARGHAQEGGRGMTPPGLAPGAPAGSYSLSGFENVNLYNGNLNFTLPLLKVGGRGRVGTSINLGINSIKWDMSFRPVTSSSSPTQPFRPRGYGETDFGAFDAAYRLVCYRVTITPSQGDPGSYDRCEIRDQYTAGSPSMPPMQLPMTPQTTGYAFFPVARPDWVAWDTEAPGYGPGIMRGSLSTAWEHYLYPNPSDPRYSDPHNHLAQTLYRMSFVEPDGTQHEFIDTYTGGRPTLHSFAPEDDVQRGRIFVSTDGSAMTFISDNVVTDGGGGITGHLFFADGTRCRVQGGLIRWVRDTDGNSVAYTYGTDPANRPSLGRVVGIRDTLGRVVQIRYGDMTSVMYDEIKFNGVGGELNRSIKVWHSRLGVALRADQSLKTVGELFPGTSRSVTLPAIQYNPVVISAFELPDHRRYQLRYNSYGGVSRVELPTGAILEYDYADPVVTSSGILHRVKERRASSDGVNWDEKQLFMPEYSVGQGNGIDGWGTAVTVETRDIKGGGDRLTSKTRHYFHGHPLLATAPELFYPSWKDGREYKVEQLDTDGAGGKVLRRQESEWRQRETPAWWQSLTHSTYQLTPSNAPARDPRVVTTTASVEPYAGGANLMSKQTSVDPSDPTGGTVGFDQFNNRTDLWEYDFGAGGHAGPLLRRTHTDFVQALNVGGVSHDYACSSEASCGQTAVADDVIHLRGLPAATEVRDAAGAVVSRGEFVYDEPNRIGDDYGALSADFPGWSPPATLARGHLTTARAWLDTLGSYDNPQAYLETHTQYDRFGNPVKTWDARQNVSEVKFSANYKYALPTQTVSADPDGGGPLTPLTTCAVYDFATGVVTDTFDANNQHTHADYEAGEGQLDRLKKVMRPDGGWTEYEYGDEAGNLYLRTRALREALPVEKVLEGYQFLDGMGRPIRLTSRTGDSTWVAAATEYDGVGRAVRVTNPYETSDYSGKVPRGALWTTTEYDALGRVWKVTTPDGAKAVTHFDGARTLVTDPAGVQRLSETDVLGRFTEVWEVRPANPATGTEPVSFPNHADVPDVTAGYKTKYTYDVLGNLRKIEQGEQRRYFAYDSLSHLLRVKNPEQDSLPALMLPAGLVSPLSDNQNAWSLKYEHDENGNLTKRTDARGVVTEYTYDALNRLTFRAYSDATPAVTYTYGDDIAANSKGRLLSVGSNVSTYSYTAYDVMGRVTASAQATGGTTYTMPEYRYDHAGNLTSETYPSGRVVETQYDAAGRVAGVRKQGGDHYAGGDPGVANNPNVIQYTAHGAAAAMRLGNGLWEHTLYNERFQPYEIGLGTSRTDSSKLRLEYGYTPAAGGAPDPSKNNGNVLSQRIHVPAEGTTPARAFMQSYTYDSLDRLESASEVNGTAETWRQTYAYDRYGNRRLDEQRTTKLNNAGATVYAIDSSNRPLMNPTISTSTNRISEVGYSFDAAGNLLCDPQHPCGSATALTPYFAYDADNRMVSAAGSAQVGGSECAYDGDGRRVKKTSGSDVTIFVYDAGGALVAEYTNEAPQPGAGGTKFLTTDSLGSPRVVTDEDGKVVSRHDYAPFGDELFGSGRTGEYKQDSVRRQFTGQQRDRETGLDFFNARYYSPTQGRFTSTDPLAGSAETADPQTWNRYAYVSNTPLTSTDPTGMFEWRMNDKTRAVDWYNEGDDRTGTTEIQPDEHGVLRYPYHGDPRYEVILNQTGPMGFWTALSAAHTRNNLLLFKLVPLPFGTVREEAQGWKLELTPEAHAAYMRTGAVEMKPDHIFAVAGLAQSGFKLASGLKAGSAATGYPPNNGFLGATENKFLMPGETIDRFGGTPFSRFFSPAGTPAAARSLPPGTLNQPLRTFEVLKPFEVRTGVTAPWFGQPGGGAQIVTPVKLETLLRRGFLKEVGP